MLTHATSDKPILIAPSADKFPLIPVFAACEWARAVFLCFVEALSS